MILVLNCKCEIVETRPGSLSMHYDNPACPMHGVAAGRINRLMRSLSNRAFGIDDGNQDARDWDSKREPFESFLLRLIHEEFNMHNDEAKLAASKSEQSWGKAKEATRLATEMHKPDPKSMAQSRLAADTRAPVPFDIYEHYKGGLYVVLSVSVTEDTLIPMVTYRSNATKAVQTRTLENWAEQVEERKFDSHGAPYYTSVPRFRQINM